MRHGLTQNKYTCHTQLSPKQPLHTNKILTNLDRAGKLILEELVAPLILLNAIRVALSILDNHMRALRCFSISHASRENKNE